MVIKSTKISPKEIPFITDEELEEMPAGYQWFIFETEARYPDFDIVISSNDETHKYVIWKKISHHQFIAFKIT